MPSNNELGTKIFQIREQREMSVADLAKNSGCSQDLITALESGELIPSLSPLMQISRALGVRLGTFLDDAESSSVVINRGGDSKAGIHFSGNSSSTMSSVLDFFPLAQNKCDRHMEPFIISVHPAESDKTLSTHEGEEFIYVLSGQLEIKYGKDSYTLEEGDSIYLDSVVPHYVYSSEGIETKILAVVFAPY